MEDNDGIKAKGREILDVGVNGGKRKRLLVNERKVKEMKRGDTEFQTVKFDERMTARGQEILDC